MHYTIVRQQKSTAYRSQISDGHTGDIPNKTTKAAIEEAMFGERNPQEIYDNTEDLMKALHV